MALTFTSQGKGTARVDHAVKGTTIKHVNMNTSTGAGGADYTTGGNGFPIRANATKLGFRTIFFAVGVSSQNATPATITNLYYLWDEVAGKLRAFIANTAVEESGANLNANSNVQMWVVGV